MSRAELANLLQDCLVVWGVEGRSVPEADGIAVIAAAGSCLVMPAGPERRPARWLWQTEARAAAGRPPQAAHSITGLLGGVREAIGADMPGPGLEVVEAEVVETDWDARP
ncbi:MAG: hypothetical protein ACREFV_04825 [Acetobacteraceae bacterium]